MFEETLPMYAEASPKPNLPQRPPRRPRRQRRPHSLGKRLAKHTATLEISTRLAVNGLLAVVALGSLGRLVPYIHAQTLRLEQVSYAVGIAEASTTRLRTDFDRYFDPAQASKIISRTNGLIKPQPAADSLDRTPRSGSGKRISCSGFRKYDPRKHDSSDHDPLGIIAAGHASCYRSLIPQGEK
ncbi:MAG: hypothetical protein HC922_11090 [Leptolyngbyaceae cyanobacterium SM2_3_12]|nr:hypothetical protein [Leptolyngbyaceae cyanobacterium SM2_3_12]